ncbi:MAG: prolipoprotein diacylglyceryl transferase [Clostridia bacterium]|nr:prolipoprotein diacylglyceryl transferase [Clostridia bacterium]
MNVTHVISFPGLGIGNLNIPRVFFHIGNFNVYWYGVLIAVGLLLALLYGAKRTKDFGVTVDDLTDVVLWSVIFGIIGARVYYVIFFNQGGDNSFFANPVSIFRIWDGGLAIYGAIIGAFVSAFIVCRVKKLNPLPFFDIAGLGFLIGQAVGRWGNFFNQEAYGSTTSLPWGMKIIDDSSDAYSGQTVTVHPCFLYESLWCALGFVLLHFYSKKHRKFRGEIFLMYAAWYSFGRFFIEILRTDSLMIGGWKVSMLLSAAVFVVAVTTILVVRGRIAKRAENDTTGYVPIYADAISSAEPEAPKPVSDIEDTSDTHEETAGSADEPVPGEAPKEKAKTEEDSDAGSDH